MTWSTLPGFVALVVALVACGTDADARFAGLSQVERRSDTLRYVLRYPAPPWKRRDADPLVSGATTRVQIGGGTREIAKGSGTVLEIGATTVAVVPGENYPKYRLEAAFVDCSDTELTSQTSCARALFEAEENARTGDATPLVRDDEAYPHFDVLTHDASGKRNQRIAFFETPAPQTALWLYLEANPQLDDDEIAHMLRSVEITPVGAP